MRKIFILFIVLLAAIPLRAQIYIGVRGGITLPNGFYADSRMSDNEWMFTQGHQKRAGAGKGFVAGLEARYEMPFLGGLSAVLDCDYLQSNMNKDVTNYFETAYARKFANCDAYEMQLPQFRHIPILLGVRYSYPLSTGLDFYGQALCGLNIRMVSDWTLSYASGEWVASDGQSFSNFSTVRTYTYNNAVTFAFRLGVGIMIRKMVSLEASYNMLGRSPLSWTYTCNDTYNVYGDVREIPTETHETFTDVNPTMVLVTLGFHLNPFKGLRRNVQDW